MDISIMDLAKLCGALVTIFGVYLKLRGEVQKMINDKSEEEERINTLQNENLEARIDGNEKQIKRFIERSIALDGELRDPGGIYSQIQKHETKIPDLENRIARLER